MSAWATVTVAGISAKQMSLKEYGDQYWLNIICSSIQVTHQQFILFLASQRWCVNWLLDPGLLLMPFRFFLKIGNLIFWSKAFCHSFKWCSHFHDAVAASRQLAAQARRHRPMWRQQAEMIHHCNFLTTVNIFFCPEFSQFFLAKICNSSRVY